MRVTIPVKQIKWGYYRFLTLLSPTLNTKARYRAVFGKKLNLKHPKTLNEKILWLKLKRYMKDPLIIQCSDKYRVREYVKRCGYGNILNELHGVYDSAKEIPWDELPDRFVLKWNFGSGMNIICPDKSKMKRDEVIKKLEYWNRSKYWLTHSEMQYKLIPKKILCERFLEADHGEAVIPDYKVYCFHGQPRAILVMRDRGKETKAEFFDENWIALEDCTKYSRPKEGSAPPLCLGEMLQAAKDLSRPFPFVRCDFYAVNDRLVFGELTFTPAGGLDMAQTTIHGVEMTEFLQI
jgi:hypothetical protein